MQFNVRRHARMAFLAVALVAMTSAIVPMAALAASPTSDSHAVMEAIQSGAPMAGKSNSGYRGYNYRNYSQPKMDHKYTPSPKTYDYPKKDDYTYKDKYNKYDKYDRYCAYTHRIKRGDTLSHIAKRYHVSISTLAKANNIKNYNRIYIGMTLCIP